MTFEEYWEEYYEKIYDLRNVGVAKFIELSMRARECWEIKQEIERAYARCYLLDIETGEILCDPVYDMKLTDGYSREKIMKYIDEWVKNQTEYRYATSEEIMNHFGSKERSTGVVYAIERQ